MSRWKVAQHIFYRSWLAYPESLDSGKPGADLAEDEPRLLRLRAFRTWREAMAYADKRARTIEVILPRNAHQNTGYMRTTPSTDGLLMEFLIGNKWEAIRVTKHELDPLALALLTQHYTTEEA